MSFLLRKTAVVADVQGERSRNNSLNSLVIRPASGTMSNWHSAQAISRITSIVPITDAVEADGLTRAPDGVHFAAGKSTERARKGIDDMATAVILTVEPSLEQCAPGPR